MLNQLLKLVDVKSVVTIALSGAYIVMSLRGDVTAEQFQSVFVTVIAFYFGTQYEKRK